MFAHQRSRGCEADSASFDNEIAQENADMVAFIDNWQVLLSLADHVANAETSSIIRDVVTNGVKYTLELLHGEEKSLTKLENFFCNMPVSPI